MSKVRAGIPNDCTPPTEVNVPCREKPDNFAAFLGEEVDAYMERMSQPGTWGDELTLVRQCRMICSVGP